MHKSKCFKKTAALVLSTAFLLTCSPATSSVLANAASSETSFMYNTNADSKDATLIGCCPKTATSITIPSSFNYSAVACIGSKVFDGFKSLKTISLPSSINGIYVDAFDGCNEKVNITLQKQPTVEAWGVLGGVAIDIHQPQSIFLMPYIDTEKTAAWNYEVYRDGKKITVHSVKDYYYDSSAKVGKTYTYQVRAYFNVGLTHAYRVYALRSTPIKVTVESPKVAYLQANRNGNDITFTWPDFTELTASKYYIYQSTSKNGSYSKIGELRPNTSLISIPAAADMPSVVTSNLAVAKTDTTHYYKVTALLPNTNERHSMGPMSDPCAIK